MTMRDFAYFGYFNACMNNLFSVLFVSSASIIWGALNYAYHPLMVQYLSTGDFAEFESLVGILNILWVLMSGASLFLMREVAKNSKNLGMVKSLFIYAGVFLGIIGLITYVLLAISSPFTANFLKLESITPVLLVSLTVVFSFPGTVVWAILSGLKKFRFIALSSVLWSLLRLVFGIAFVFFGYRLYGAIGAFVLSTACIFFLNLSYVWYILKKHTTVDNRESFKKDIQKDSLYIFHFFLLAFLLAILMNMDVIFVKNLYDTNTAWVYAGISVVAKFLVFLWSSIETVYYPQIMEHEKEQVPKHFLINASLMLVILSISALAFNYCFWGFILDIMKRWFSQYHELFLLTLVFFGFYMFINLYAKILIGWRQYAINYVLWAWITLLMILLIFFGDRSIDTFIYLFIGIACTITIVASIFIYSAVSKKKIVSEVEDFI